MNTFTYSDIEFKIMKRIVPNHVAITKSDIVKAMKEGLNNNSVTEITETTYQVVTGTLEEISKNIALALVFDARACKAELKFTNDVVVKLEYKHIASTAYCFMYFKDKTRIADITYALFPDLFINYVKNLLKDTDVDINADNIQLKYIVSSGEVTI